MIKPHINETVTPSARQSAGQIFRNARALLSGKAIGGVLSLAYLSIAARSLGPTEMGYLVLAHAYVLVIVGIARFQSWQSIIRFGAPLIATDNARDFKTLIRFTAKIDLASAVFVIVISTAFAGLVGELMNWPQSAMPYVYAYCVAAPFLMAATPAGILRLFDRFKTLGWQLALLPIIRFIGAMILWAIGGDLTGFFVVWILSAVLHGVSLWVLGWLVLRRRDLLPSLSRTPGEKAPRAWLPFMIKTNLSSTVDELQNNLPVLLVGALLGGATSGFLQMAINLSNLIAHPTNMLNEATFPELTKIAHAQGKKAMRSVAFRSARTGVLFAAPVVIVYVLLRDFLAVAVGGPEFADAAILIALMAVAQLWRITSVVMQSAVVALGRAGFVLGAQTVSALITIPLMVFLLPRLGAAGAPTAIIATWLALIAMYSYALSMKNGVPMSKEIPPVKESS